MSTQTLAPQNLKYGLFLKQRFLPIFLATFLGALNDNILRSGLVVLIAYSASHGIALPGRPEIMVTVCSALIAIPLLLFSSIAGTLADKFEKSALVKCAKIIEIAIMATACYGFATNNILLLMGLLFVSGAHTAFYSPIKFSILPDHLHQKELLVGNGFMAGGSYLAILCGLITGGLLAELPYNLIGFTALNIAILGFVASLFILPSSVTHPQTKIDFNIWQSSKAILLYAYSDRTIRHSMIGLSWFLLVGSVFMSQFANYAQAVLHADNEVYILFLTIFSIGIAIGSLLCDTLLKGEISLRLTPLTLFGISLFTYGMVAATPQALPPHMALQSLMEFIAAPHHWVILACMLMVAICGGLYLVPLYAMLQAHTPAHYRSRVMAASNLNDALFAAVAALASALLLTFKFHITDLFLIVATLNVPVIFYARKYFS